MVKLCSPNKNYAAYRKCYDAAMGLPRIPCLQIFLKDVKMVDSLHPSLNEEGLIDVYKILYMWKVLTSAIPYYSHSLSSNHHHQQQQQQEHGVRVAQSPSIGHRPVGYAVSVRCEAREGRCDGLKQSSSYGSLMSSIAEARNNLNTITTVIEQIDTDREKENNRSISRHEHEYHHQQQQQPRQQSASVSRPSPFEALDKTCNVIIDEATDDAETAATAATADVTATTATTTAATAAPSHSLAVLPSFEDACGALRESLFEPIRNSASTLLASQEQAGHSFSYKWDMGSGSIAAYDEEDELTDPGTMSECGSVDRHSPLHTAVAARSLRKSSNAISMSMSGMSISGRGSEILASIFGPAGKATDASTSLLHPTDNISSEKLFTLNSTDSELVDLLWKIRKSTADLSNLWNDSKVASFAETGRLLLELCKAGLI
jgi:hypothetical protein